MTSQETELLISIIAGYKQHGGRCLEELQDAIQDCGYTDREIIDMSHEALVRSQKDEDK